MKPYWEAMNTKLCGPPNSSIDSDNLNELASATGMNKEIGHDLVSQCLKSGWHETEWQPFSVSAGTLT